MDNLTTIIKNQKIDALIRAAEEDWKDVDFNLATTVRTGVSALDNIIYGFNNEMAGIIGPSGSRKTTFLLNVLNFNATSKKVGSDRIPQVYLTVEAGMRPSRLRDNWLAMKATQYLRHKKQRGEIPITVNDYLFTDFFKFHEPNEYQQTAIDWAKGQLASSDVHILGSGEFGGVEDISNYADIFKAIHEQVGYCAIYIDHLHAIYSPYKASDYEHIIYVTNEIANLMKKYGQTVIIVGQVSSTSMRVGSMETRGGTRLREECSTYLNLKYTRTQNVRDSSNHSLEIFIDKSRKSEDKIAVNVEMEPNSGLFVSDGNLIEEDVKPLNVGIEMFDTDSQYTLF